MVKSGWIWNSFETFYSCPRYLQNEDDPIKNEDARVLTLYSDV